MRTNECDEHLAPGAPRQTESGKPASSRHIQATAKEGPAKRLVAALLLLSVIPLAAGVFRLVSLAGGAASRSAWAQARRR